MNAPWLWSDSGLRDGAAQAALDRAQLAACARGEHAGMLRFARYRPTASLGAHEDADLALRMAYCTGQGIDIVRRDTGGGALYLDPQQLTVTLTLDARAVADADLAALVARLTGALVAGLAGLGVAAGFQAPNDIELDGRKLGAGFIAELDGVLLFQATLLLDIDPEAALKVLRVPTEKLSAEGVLSARQRYASLRECLGEIPDMDRLQTAMLGGFSAALGEAMLKVECLILNDGGAPGARPSLKIALPAAEALRSFLKTPGGLLRAALWLAPDGETVMAAELGGSLQLRPAGLLPALAAALTGVAVADVPAAAQWFFARVRHDMLAVTPADIGYLLARALARRDQRRRFGLSIDQANTLMVHSPERDREAGDIVAEASVMLVPYCAKPAWCKWRHRDGCPECGLCEVGGAYRLARERGMRVVTIANFEHLSRTLADMRAAGVPAYVGMCCENFYIKRQHAFATAGMPAVLMDITGSNCYELRQEDAAYAGRFQAQARLKLDVLEPVMAQVPPCLSERRVPQRRKERKGRQG